MYFNRYTRRDSKNLKQTESPKYLKKNKNENYAAFSFESEYDGKFELQELNESEIELSENEEIDEEKFKIVCYVLTKIEE